MTLVTLRRYLSFMHTCAYAGMAWAAGAWDPVRRSVAAPTPGLAGFVGKMACQLQDWRHERKLCGQR